MSPRSRLWRAGAAFFVVFNVAGAVYAAAMGQQLHTASHVLLLMLGIGAYTVWGGRRPRQDLANGEPADERLQYLQQSVDAIAVEVERIGEKQRYYEKLQAERDVTLPLSKERDSNR